MWSLLGWAVAEGLLNQGMVIVIGGASLGASVNDNIVVGVDEDSDVDSRDEILVFVIRAWAWTCWRVLWLLLLGGWDDLWCVVKYTPMTAVAMNRRLTATQRHRRPPLETTHLCSQAWAFSTHWGADASCAGEGDAWYCGRSLNWPMVKVMMVVREWDLVDERMMRCGSKSEVIQSSELYKWALSSPRNEWMLLLEENVVLWWCGREKKKREEKKREILFKSRSFLMSSVVEQEGGKVSGIVVQIELAIDGRKGRMELLQMTSDVRIQRQEKCVKLEMLHADLERRAASKI
jgi:hypothetical protein